MAPEGDSAVETELVDAIRGGDVPTVRRLVDADPALATTRLGGGAAGRTALHVVTDWPGYLPAAPAVAQLLLDAGADPEARGPGRHPETPLHWTASNDDVDLAVVLIDAGADLEAPAGSIGTPLDNAIGYGCWHVARLLVERGATVDKLWQAAALGMTERVRHLLESEPAPTARDLDEALWQACHGGQYRIADLLLGRGADLDAVPGYAGADTVLDVTIRPDTRRGLMHTWLRGLPGLRSQSPQDG